VLAAERGAYRSYRLKASGSATPFVETARKALVASSLATSVQQTRATPWPTAAAAALLAFVLFSETRSHGEGLITATYETLPCGQDRMPQVLRRAGYCCDGDPQFFLAAALDDREPTAHGTIIT
jgi:hypothetical protein